MAQSSPQCKEKIAAAKSDQLLVPIKVRGSTPVWPHPLIPPSLLSRHSLTTMARKDDDQKVTVVKQGVYPVPDIPIKDLLDAIPYVANTTSFFQMSNVLSISPALIASNGLL